MKFTKEFYALYDINLDIKKGESVAFYGPEFSGKTTILRVFSRIRKTKYREVYIKRKPLKKINFECDVDMGYIPAIRFL